MRPKRTPSPARTHRTIRAQLWPFQANQTKSAKTAGEDQRPMTTPITPNVSGERRRSRLLGGQLVEVGSALASAPVITSSQLSRVSTCATTLSTIDPTKAPIPARTVTGAPPAGVPRSRRAPTARRRTPDRALPVGRCRTGADRRGGAALGAAGRCPGGALAAGRGWACGGPQPGVGPPGAPPCPAGSPYGPGPCPAVIARLLVVPYTPPYHDVICYAPLFIRIRDPGRANPRAPPHGADGRT